MYYPKDDFKVLDMCILSEVVEVTRTIKEMYVHNKYDDLRFGSDTMAPFASLKKQAETLFWLICCGRKHCFN